MLAIDEFLRINIEGLDKHPVVSPLEQGLARIFEDT
jgi:hypothetical protein